ncbi:MAG: hypothetical protein KatS3mg109_1896 [Pirellulaceae bacterium]|nr:MAG: hypothetical protein KatS3mg109_1896 [Pirellulaceae bacterium]
MLSNSKALIGFGQALIGFSESGLICRFTLTDQRFRSWIDGRNGDRSSLNNNLGGYRFGKHSQTELTSNSTNHDKYEGSQCSRDEKHRAIHMVYSSLSDKILVRLVVVVFCCELTAGKAGCTGNQCLHFLWS